MGYGKKPGYHWLEWLDILAMCPTMVARELRAYKAFQEHLL